MEYQDFLGYMEKSVADFMGESFRVTLKHVIKNNGVLLDGLVILEKGKNISPTIYMNSYYEAYQSGVSLTDIVKEIVNVYEKNHPEGKFQVDFFKDYAQAKKRIVYKLVNYEKNEELLKKVPHRKFLDLALVCYCMVLSEMTGNASILIYNSHLNMWGIGENELFEAAEENTERLLRAEIVDIRSLMLDIMQTDLRDFKQHFGEEKESTAEFSEFLEEAIRERRQGDMYVLTNHMRVNGAVCMIYSGLLRKFADDVGESLYILPSSVHEVIIVPKRAGIHPGDLVEMVREVNRKEVEAEEVLSNSVYSYDRITDQIEKI